MSPNSRQPGGIPSDSSIIYDLVQSHLHVYSAVQGQKLVSLTLQGKRFLA